MTGASKRSQSDSDSFPLREAFLRWQCRVRQIAMRERKGQPDDSVMPFLTLPNHPEPQGQIITVLSKARGYSKLPEIQHIVRRTNDPAQRREKAIALFSEMYYQKADEFSDVLTATFLPGSKGARTIVRAKTCQLTFNAYSQRFDLECKVNRLSQHDPLYQATWWHNKIFNPNLNPETIVLGFKPQWELSSAEPNPIA